MKTIETKVYTIDELSDAAKEKARDWYKQGNDYDMLSEAMSEHLVDLLADNKIKCEDPKVMYSLSYCQGDGAMFEGVCEWKKYTVKVKHLGNYYHYNSKDFTNWTITKTGEEPDLTADEWKKLEEDFNTVYVKVCRALEKYGYDWIEVEDADENVDDNILANEYTFTAEGKRFG